jgi:hypothetical protein
LLALFQKFGPVAATVALCVNVPVLSVVASPTVNGTPDVLAVALNAPPEVVAQVIDENSGYSVDVSALIAVTIFVATVAAVVEPPTVTIDLLPIVTVHVDEPEAIVPPAVIVVTCVIGAAPPTHNWVAALACAANAQIIAAAMSQRCF